MQLFLGAVPIILRLFSNTRGHLLFSNSFRNNLPKPNGRIKRCTNKNGRDNRQDASLHCIFKQQGFYEKLCAADSEDVHLHDCMKLLNRC